MAPTSGNTRWSPKVVVTRPGPPMTDGSRVVSLTPLVEAVRKAREAGPTREVDWDLVYRIADQQSGIPVRITIGS